MTVLDFLSYFDQHFQFLYAIHNYHVLNTINRNNLLRIKRNCATELDEEERRGVREGLDEEELAIFDLLCVGTELSEKEREQVKIIEKELLEKIRDDLVIDWRKKQQARARVKEHIQEVLDNLPDIYDSDNWNHTFEAVYQHVFQAYRGQGDLYQSSR